MFTALLAVVLSGTQPTPAPATTYAVLDIANEKGEVTALSAFIGDELSLRYASDSGYSLVERGQLKKVLREQNLQASGALDETTTATLGKTLGATRIVTGQYYPLGDDFLAMVRVLDVATGKVLRMTKVSFPKSNSTQSLSLSVLVQAPTAPEKPQPAPVAPLANPTQGPLSLGSCKYDRPLIVCKATLQAQTNGRLDISREQQPFFLNNGNFVKLTSYNVGNGSDNSVLIPAGIKTNVTLYFASEPAANFTSFQLKYSFAGEEFFIDGPRPIE